MARRKKSTFFEDMMDVVSMLPWWMGLVLAVISYLWLHNVATQPRPHFPREANQLGETLVSHIWITIALFMQYLIPVICVLGASISAFKKFNKKVSLELSQNHFGGNPHEKSKSEYSSPECPNCGTPMVKRVAKKGERSGEAFWGCTHYPKCKGTRAIS